MKKIFLMFIALFSLVSFTSCELTVKNDINSDVNKDDDNETKQYIVSFDTNGGSSISSLTLDFNSIPTKPSNPTKDGYVFVGWYLDTDLSTEYTFSYSFNSNVILYAKWSVISYSITYVLDGGNNASDNPTTYNVESETIILADASKNDYTFAGWYSDDNFENKVTEITKGSIGDKTLYAKWTESENTDPIVTTYTITLDTNGGDALSCNTLSVTNGATFTLPEPTRTGYTFAGWYNGGTLVESGTYSFTTDIRLTAKWTLIEDTTYTITFDTNGGSSISALTTDSDGKISVPSNPTKSGYSFAGWYSDSTLKTSVDLSTAIFTANTTIYAKWLSTDAKLTSIIVNNNPITVNTTTDEYEYSENNMESFSVEATTSSAYATVSGISSDAYSITLGGTKTITITVTAEAGNTKTYTLTVTSKIVESNTTLSSITSVNESIGITWEDSGISNVKVEYKLTSDETYTEIDEELIRYTSSTGIVRADIVGLKAGTYDLKVTTNDSNTITKSNVVVTAIDRSGYAHFNYTDGVGAYKDDGTLKTGAEIIYVSDETKNTVTYTVGSTTYTGLVEILKNASKFEKPVVVRILDSIKTNQWSEKSDEPRLADGTNYTTDSEKNAFATNTLETTYSENLVGLTSKVMVIGYKTFTYTSTKTGFSTKSETNSKSSTTTYNRTAYSDITGKTVYDDDSYFNMIDISGSTNGLTIEGIGTEAEFYQFGMTFSKCSNIEVKNLTFTNCPEDACSFQGGSNTDNDYGRYFIHNCVFNRGLNNWDVSGERDKYAGDGAIDLKYCHNVTLSNNVFNNCKKTGLVGGGDANIQYNITFHHNYYNQVESRLPLGRQANIHIYNNYYYKCNVTIDIRANAYAFLEANYFEESLKPRTTIKSSSSYYPFVKSYNDVYDNCSDPTSSYGTAYIAESRTSYPSTYDSTVNGCNINGTDYSKFDTDSSLFYYDATNNKSNVTLLETASDAKNTCITYAGVLKTTYGE